MCVCERESDQRACAARSQRRGSAPRWAALPEPLCFKRLGFRRAPVVQEVLGFRRGSGRLLLNPTRAKWLQGSGFSRGGSVDSPDARFLRRTRSTSLSSFFTWAARSSFRSRVSGFGFRVSGFGVRVPGFGVRGYLGRALALRLAGARHHRLGVLTLLVPPHHLEAGSYLRLIDSCITQLKAQGPSRTCNERKGEEKKHHLPSPESLQGYLAHKKVTPPRPYAQGHMVVLGWWAHHLEPLSRRHLPVRLREPSCDAPRGL